MTRRLDVYTALWAMQPHDQSGVKLPYEQVVEKVAGAGYAGMALDFGATSAEDIRRIQPMMARAGLTPFLVDFPKTVEGLRPTLRMAKDFGAPFVVVIGQVMPLSVEGMIPVIRAWIEMSEQEGMPVLFETHRNCITNDLYATLLLLDAVPEMRLCADLSHYVTGREMSFPIPRREMGHISRILARSDSFQGRVAGRGQIQLPLGWPSSRKWEDLFRGWWREGLAGWRARNADGTCIFLCELGPPDYALTGPDGREMSDRWEEALVLKGWAEEIWAELEAG
ncbi:sugar phosphate isomerase/epimerase [Mangrovicoccus sp. HB161399]|uniref:sugar phosphate isomerase/epimerase family protein n=1 Tax=Mangrovicoccus sp. HB161399 TaxID=2720392 RepID=UPI0020A6C2B6|nr:sugar phosphate isomerase/epimerase [Mangrovicoccus sp. HB161399]